MKKDYEFLASAKPNRRYRWHRCLEGIEIEAVRGNRNVTYYELDRKAGIRRRMVRDRVKECFKPGSPVKDQPFRVSENGVFWEIVK